MHLRTGVPGHPTSGRENVAGRELEKTFRRSSPDHLNPIDDEKKGRENMVFEAPETAKSRHLDPEECSKEEPTAVRGGHVLPVKPQGWEVA